MRRLFAALAIGAAAFGIASAVQASIPDASGIVHACYTDNNLPGYPPGALRAIDTAKINGVCGQNEAPVDLATPQFVTSTINQTSFKIRASGTIPGPNFIQGNFFCGTGYIATDFGAAATDNTFGSNIQLTVNSLYNEGEVIAVVPSTFGHLYFHISTTLTVSIEGTCVDARVFGLPGPVLPIATAMSQASVSLKRAA